jgi:hypothetical protein
MPGQALPDDALVAAEGRDMLFASSAFQGLGVPSNREPQRSLNHLPFFN